MTGLRHFLDQVVAWAASEPDVHAVGLAGSWARGTAHAGSDVDLVVLVEDVDVRLAGSDWTAAFGEHGEVSDEDWGRLQARRVRYDDGLEVEFGLTTSTWADLPLDPGTAGVLSGGFRVLHDPTGLLHRAVSSVTPRGRGAK